MSAQAELDGNEVRSKGSTGPGRAAQGGGWHQGERRRTPAQVHLDVPDGSTY